MYVPQLVFFDARLRNEFSSDITLSFLRFIFFHEQVVLCSM